MATSPTRSSGARGTAASTQTNQPIDPQATVDLLAEMAKRHIQSEMDALRPEIEAKINELVASAKQDLMQQIDESKTQLQEVKNSVLGAVAVFAAFFTFVSVNVNIFSKANPLESIALMIVMWICLMGFTYTFFLFLWDKWRAFVYWLPVMIGMAITCGILYFVKDQSEVLAADSPKISEMREGVQK